MTNQNSPLELPRLLQRKTLFEESLIKIRCDQLQIASHPPYQYYSLVTPPFAVAILAITDSGEYILNEEYRHPTGKILLGCPGGYIDPGEDPLTGALRELLEETGAGASSAEIIGSAYPYAGFSGQKTLYARARHAVLSCKPTPEASEVIRPILLSPEALREAIAKGVELDGTLCTALFFHQTNP